MRHQVGEGEPTLEGGVRCGETSERQEPTELRDEVEAALGTPHLPKECAAATVDGMSLASIRDYMTQGARDVAMERAVSSVAEQWLNDHKSVEPLQSIRSLVDSIRTLARGDERLKRMNSLVRTLGQPEMLATFLDMILDSSQRTGTREEALSRISQNASQHCIYGWSGQTLLITSSSEPTKGTLEAETGVYDILGEAPLAVWGLSMHIWQPNPCAQGFSSEKRFEPGIIMEPPHSHPFDFVSMVTIGGMRQSIYAQCGADNTPVQIRREAGKGRYDGVRLEHVHGVWPPHNFRTSTKVVTLEERVPLIAGDSYYMPCDRIHDVEIDSRTASETPTITLFLASEAVVKPHVYMAPSMADFHEANPDLKRRGRAQSPADWTAKLDSVAAYLRGTCPTLNLGDIVRYDGKYAFFHT